VWLAQKPEFFIEILTLLFRRSDELETERPEPSEYDLSRAIQAERLLKSWHRVPGTQADGSVDGDALHAWTQSVQILAEKEARRVVAEIRIGNVFAYSPPEKDADTAWPCISVRDVIDEFWSQALANGFEVGIIYQRGLDQSTLAEGEAPKERLAKQYFDWAEASRIEWPKTAACLQRVSEHYEAEARREDAKAKAR